MEFDPTVAEQELNEGEDGGGGAASSAPVTDLAVSAVAGGEDAGAEGGEEREEAERWHPYHSSTATGKAMMGENLEFLFCPFVSPLSVLPPPLLRPSRPSAAPVTHDEGE